MNAKYFIVAVLALSSAVYVSCRKAGKGGKAKLSIHFYEKDNDPVFGGWIYIKYNATTFPGSDVSVYDNHDTTDYGAKVKFENLRRGDYYLYGVKDSIAGGTYFKIDNRIGEREVVIIEDKYCDLVASGDSTGAVKCTTQ